MAQSKLSMQEAEHQDNITLNWTIPNFMAVYETAQAQQDLLFIREEFSILGKEWTFNLAQNEISALGIMLGYEGAASGECTVQLKPSEGELTHTLQYENYGDSNNQPTWLWFWESLSEPQNQGFLKDDTLTLKFIVKATSRNEYLKMNAVADLKRGLYSAVGSDVIFTLVQKEGSQNVEIKAHSQILSLRSSVFAGMSGRKDATNGYVKVEIGDMSPKAFRILLEFLYSGEVNGEWITVAAELFYGAHKYELADLQKYLAENLDPVLTVDNVLEFRNLATLYNLPSAEKSIVTFIHNNLKEFLENHQCISKNTSV